MPSPEPTIDELRERNALLELRLAEGEREQTEYLQNVSHQLVAPLNAIKWHIENLTEARVGLERAKKVLRSIYSQATIAVHLAKNFNLMSNLEADHSLSRLKEPLQDVNLQKLLINIADDFQPLAWDQDIRIEVDKHEFPEHPVVLAMRPLIGQVFSNIIENAVKYSHADTDIIIKGAFHASDGTFEVTVQNQGIPLPEDRAERVFSRGFRSREAQQKYPAGTGFGLYIARRIVEIHEGEISAGTDALGRAVFTVSLSVRRLEGKARERGPKDRTPDRR